jgi:hypothetical protein
MWAGIYVWLRVAAAILLCWAFQLAYSSLAFVWSHQCLFTMVPSVMLSTYRLVATSCLSREWRDIIHQTHCNYSLSRMSFIHSSAVKTQSDKKKNFTMLPIIHCHSSKIIHDVTTYTLSLVYYLPYYTLYLTCYYIGYMKFVFRELRVVTVWTS